MRLYYHEIKEYLAARFDDLDVDVRDNTTFEHLANGFASYCAGNFRESVEKQFKAFFVGRNDVPLSVEQMTSKADYELNVT